ncbi:unnamed protein product [Chrysoparadoxa australica]
MSPFLLASVRRGVIPALSRSAKNHAQALPQRRKMGSMGTTTTGKDIQGIWLGDKGAWPVIGVIGVALALCTGFMARIITTHPDIHVSTKPRGIIVRGSDSNIVEVSYPSLTDFHSSQHPVG